MGFAGQVFAARVAVGLAMPSPKAFSQAGATIGGFASKMYNNLNQKGTQAAKKNLQTAEQNLANARSKLESHNKTQQEALERGAKQSVKRLQGAYKDLGKTSLASTGAMKGMTSGLTSQFDRMTGGMGRGLGTIRSMIPAIKGVKMATCDDGHLNTIHLHLLQNRGFIPQGYRMKDLKLDIRAFLYIILAK